MEIIRKQDKKKERYDRRSFFLSCLIAVIISLGE